MLSIPIPHSLALSVCSSHLKREGPYGSFLTPTGDLKLQLLNTPTSRRLFIQPSPSSNPASHQARSFLAFLAARRHGLAYGYRRRLRLVGVGFRASTSSPSPTTLTTLKLGYSHELTVSASNGSGTAVSSKHHLELPNVVSLQASRIDGRAKGTLLLLQGPDLGSVNQAAAKVRSLRYPDPYKGKGIHYDREVLRLKKGKGDR
jgi:large subunit ribosomal protein L6